MLMTWEFARQSSRHPHARAPALCQLEFHVSFIWVRCRPVRVFMQSQERIRSGARATHLTLCLTRLPNSRFQRPGQPWAETLRVRPTAPRIGFGSTPQRPGVVSPPSKSCSFGPFCAWLRSLGIAACLSISASPDTDVAIEEGAGNLCIAQTCS